MSFELMGDLSRRSNSELSHFKQIPSRHSASNKSPS
jgi:hypothetical protein